MMGRSRKHYKLFEISLPALVRALDRSTPFPMVWSDDVGDLYLKAKEIYASGDDMEEDAVIHKYLAQGYTDGDVKALIALVDAMASEAA